MTEGPWEFGEAVQKDRNATAAQKSTEAFLRDSYRRFAEAESAYRQALAVEIVRQHSDGAAWTVAPDLARGDKQVAELRMRRDIAEGVVEAAKQAAWRAAGDRRAVERYATWSMRRELAEAGVGA
jgi:chlorite dismutase